MLKIIFDTNVYLAMAFEPAGFCNNLMRRIIDEKSQYLIYTSGAIIEELKEKTDLYIKRGVLIENDVKKQQLFLQDFLYRIQPTEKISVVATDPDDDKILECAVAAKADLIITMDRHLLKLKSFRDIGIIHPKTFFFMIPHYKNS